MSTVPAHFSIMGLTLHELSVPAPFPADSSSPSPPAPWQSAPHGLQLLSRAAPVGALCGLQPPSALIQLLLHGLLQGQIPFGDGWGRLFTQALPMLVPPLAHCYGSLAHKLNTGGHQGNGFVVIIEFNHRTIKKLHRISGIINHTYDERGDCRASNAVLPACPLLILPADVNISASGLWKLPENGSSDGCHVPKDGGLREKKAEQG